MIKDLLVNLSTGTSDKATGEYVISLAREFNAHLAAVAFAYEPVLIAMLDDGVPPVWYDEMLKEAEDAARATVDKFNETTRGSGISAEARWVA